MRTPSKFKQGDMTKALKALQASGCHGRVLFDSSGTIIIEVTGGKVEQPTAVNPWDTV